jgi:hypothetical protein
MSSEVYEYGNEVFEGPYETSYAGESPLQEIFQQEAPNQEFGGMQEGLFNESSLQENDEYEFQETPELSGEIAQQEHDELALTTELLEIQSEDEIDRFLGRLAKRAARGAGGFMRSAQGRMLSNILRQAARRVLPIAGRAIGTYLGGPAGGAIGANLANSAGQRMGLELEGLSQEEANFATARQFIRFATDAARNAAMAAPSTNPGQIARTAVQRAAQRFAPGLLGPQAGRVPVPRFRTGLRRGVWVRRGRTITLYGV